MASPLTVVALIVVCVVVALALGYGIGNRRGTSRHRDPGSGARTPTAAEVATLRTRLRQAETELTRTEAALGAGAGVGAPATGPGRPVVEALWGLELLRQQRDRRRAVWLTTPDPEAGPPGLTQALAAEVSRVREDVGTPGELYGTLASEPAPHVALLVLRSAQATLDVLAHRAEALVIRLDDAGADVEFTVVCEGAGEGPAADADTDAIDRAIHPAGGRLEVDRNEGGQLCARLRLPGD